MLGLTVAISPKPQEHEVQSNKESSYGRYDLAVLPKDATK